MKPYLLYITGTIFLAFIQIAASAQCLLSGYVRDTAGAGIPYCTVSLQDENRTVIAGTVSDTAGRYRLTIQPGKNYFIACTHLAFQSASVPVTASRDTTVNFALVTATNRIDPVVVTAKFIDYKAGKYTVGISGNPIAENRSTQELLGLLPGVTSYESEYKINGQPVAIIYIGDREITNRKELEALRAEDIERIEIQNKAGSAYDATLTGGIIRITLKKLSSGSYYGNVYAYYSRPKIGSISSGGIPFSMQYKEINIYNYLGFSFENTSQKTYKKEIFYIPNYINNSDGKVKTDYIAVQENISLVYEPSDRNSFGLGGSFSWASSKPEIFQQNQYKIYKPTLPVTLPESTSSDYVRNGNVTNQQYQITLNYKFKIDTFGSMLDIKADYLYNNIDKYYNHLLNSYHSEVTQPLETSCYKEIYFPNSNLFESRAEYNKVFTNNRSLNSGIRYHQIFLSNRTNTYDLDGGQWIEDDAGSSDFRNRITGSALYSEFSDSYGKFSYLFGLNLQWDRIAFREDGSSPWAHRDFYRMFPNASFAYIWNNSRLNLDLSRYSGSLPTTELVPKAIRVDENTYIIGNPNLNPSIGYEIDLSFILQGKWNLSYSYWNNRNSTYTALFFDPVNSEIIYQMPVNMGRSAGQSITIEYNSTLTHWLRIDSWIVGSRSKYTSGKITEISNQLNIGLDLYFQFLPSFGGKLMFNADTPRKYLEGRWNGTYQLSCELYKAFFHNKLNIKLTFAGIFYNNRIITKIKADGSYYSRTYSPGRRQWLSLSVGYRFNHNVKKQISKTESLLIMKSDYN